VFAIRSKRSRPARAFQINEARGVAINLPIAASNAPSASTWPSSRSRHGSRTYAKKLKLTSGAYT